MKSLKLLATLLLFVGFTFIACDEDDSSSVPDNITLNSAVNLSSDQAGSSIEITSDNNPLNVLDLSWQRPSATENVAIFHYVLVDNAGNGFANPVELTKVLSNSASISGSALNEAMATLGALPGISTPIEVRIHSTVNDVDFLPSNSITLNVTAYDPNDTSSAFLYIAEDYPNWNFLTAEKLTSPNDDGIYGNPYYIFDAAKTFNLVTPSGDVWGSGDDFEGQFLPGGNPIMIEEAGMYDFQVNPGAEFFTSRKMVWGIIGAATPLGWGEETPMNLDLSTGIWTISAVLNAPNEMKFRANQNWDFNLGDNNFDGSLEPGGANIPVSTGGLTNITLDLSDPQNPTYMIGDEVVEEIMSGNFMFLSTDGMTTAGMESVYSVDADGKYNGFVYLTSSVDYSLIDPDYDSGSVFGVINVADTGLYKLVVDIANEEANATLIESMAVVGPASTIGDWPQQAEGTDGEDVDMMVDAANKMISITTDLTANEFKFRANNAWSINLGDNDADGTLEQDGTNLSVSTDGTYTIMIDLSNDMSYTYTIQ